MGVDRERRVPGTKRASSCTASSMASHFSTSARSSLQTSLSTMLLTRATPLFNRSWPRSFDGFKGVATAASAASLPGFAAGLVVAERAAVVARSGSRACILLRAAFCESTHAFIRHQRSDRAQAQAQRVQAAACTLCAAVSTRPGYASARTNEASAAARTNASQSWLLPAYTQHSVLVQAARAELCLVRLSSVGGSNELLRDSCMSPALVPSPGTPSKSKAQRL